MAGVAAGLPAGVRLSDHISLGVIARAVPPERVRQVLAETGKASERERDLPAPVMVYYCSAILALTCLGPIFCCVVLRWEAAVRKRYRVTLTAEEREALGHMISRGKAAARRLVHARVLLQADASEGGPDWTDTRIAEAVRVSVRTIGRVRQRFVEDG